MNIISSIKAFRRKQFPDGEIRKLKACIYAQGFEQKKGIDYFETFAPVVQWMTVCVSFIMILLLYLHNKQIDYSTVFLQSPPDHDDYVEMPKMFTSPGKFWLLKKVLY